MKNFSLSRSIATWFGCGYSRFASGTVGSLGALPLAWLIHVTLGWLGLLTAAIVMYIVGLWASKRYLAQHATTPDPKEIVVDEVAGQMLALVLLMPTLGGYVLGFLLFRIFDVIKPWPICVVDKKTKGATGVMVDDMLAGLAAMLTPVLLLVGLDAAGISISADNSFLNAFYHMIGYYVPPVSQ